MKKIFFPVLIIFWMLNTSFFLSTTLLQTNETAKEISTALSKANARDVAKHFGNTVDLKLPGNEGTYSRNHAELLLRNFFTRNTPGSFAVQHHGPSRDGSVYVIGEYKSKENKSFRTYFLLKKIDDKMVLHLLQMEEQ